MVRLSRRYGAMFALCLLLATTMMTALSLQPKPAHALPPEVPATLNLISGPPGTPVTATATGWEANDQICIFWDTVPNVPLACGKTDNNGYFSIKFTVPQNTSIGEQHRVFIDNMDHLIQSTTVTFTITSTPVPTSKRQALFIFIRGLTSGLTDKDINNTKNGDYGDYNTIRKTILETNGFQDSRFLFFSYNSSSKTDGEPQSYTCEQTGDKHISDYLSLLNTQINNALNEHPHTDVYLIGDSQGGVIAYAYLSSLIGKLGVSLPSGKDDQLKGVFTLDSPIGGTPNNTDFLRWTEIVFAAINCNALLPTDPVEAINALLDGKVTIVSANDLVNLFATAANTPPPDDGPRGTDPQGAQAGIALTLPKSINMSNEQVAEQAAAKGISVLTIGSPDDLLWHPDKCPVIKNTLSFIFSASAPSVNITDTQYIEDEGHASGAYGRTFTVSNPCNPLSGAGSSLSTLVNIINGNHNIVHFNHDVQLGIREVLEGKSPTSLTSPVDKGPK